MKSNNIIYLFDNKLIELNNNTFYEISFNKSTVYNGIVLNKERFINEYKKFLKQNKLNNFFTKRKYLIYDYSISINDLNVLKIIFNEMQIKIIKFVKDISVLKVNKNNAFLLGNNLLKLIYITNYGMKKVIKLNINDYSKKELLNLIKYRVSNSLVIISCNNYLYNLFNGINNYYFINDKEKYLIKIFKSSLF